MKVFIILGAINALLWRWALSARMGLKGKSPINICRCGTQACNIICITRSVFWLSRFYRKALWRRQCFCCGLADVCGHRSVFRKPVRIERDADFYSRRDYTARRRGVYHLLDYDYRRGQIFIKKKPILCQVSDWLLIYLGE